jgi:hypothetical protein
MKWKKFGTWNVRSIYEGKLDIVIKEMTRIDLEILGISELRWVGKGHFKTQECMYVRGGP